MAGEPIAQIHFLFVGHDVISGRPWMEASLAVVSNTRNRKHFSDRIRWTAIGLRLHTRKMWHHPGSDNKRQIVPRTPARPRGGVAEWRSGGVAD